MSKYRLCIAFCVFLWSDCIATGIEKPNNGIFGLKIGFVEGSDIDAGWTNYDTDGGLSLGLFADQSVSRSMSLGFYLEFDEVVKYSDNNWMMGLGMTVKAGFPSRRPGIAFRPGVGIGYAYVAGPNNSDRLHFGTVRGSAEILFSLGPRMGFLSEVVLVAAPVGGNSGRWRTMDPRLSFRVGLVF